MRKSTVTIKSNVYIRRLGTKLLDDRSFLQQVRGLKATRHILRLMGLPPEILRDNHPQILQLVRQGKLTESQRSCLAWDLPCAECNRVPVGVTFDGRVEFRCDRKGCGTP